MGKLLNIIPVSDLRQNGNFSISWGIIFGNRSYSPRPAVAFFRVSGASLDAQDQGTLPINPH